MLDLNQCLKEKVNKGRPASFNKLKGSFNLSKSRSRLTPKGGGRKKLKKNGKSVGNFFGRRPASNGGVFEEKLMAINRR